MEVEHSVVVFRPVKASWAVFDDPDLRPAWQPDLIAYEHLEGTPGRIGAVAELTLARDGGKETVLTETIIERDARRRTVMARYEGMQLPFTITSRLAALDDESSEWSAVVEVQLGLLQRALAPVLKPALADLAAKNGAAFKQYVEAR